MLERHFRKLLWQVRRGKGPVSIEIRCPKPSASDEIVDRAVSTLAEEITFNQYKFRGRIDDMNCRHRTSGFTEKGFFDIFPIVIRGQFHKTIRQLTRRSPWSIQICGSQPARLIT